ncbi:MAG: CBS domain-containing protein [Planctomycetota bacterium]|jgi:CBS domain-containing protein
MKTSHRQLKLNSAASTGTMQAVLAQNAKPICEKCGTRHWAFRLCPLDNKAEQGQQPPPSPANPSAPPSPPERFKPTCKICGAKHWPLDPSCIGKKAAKARARARAKAEKKARAEAKARAKAQARAGATADRLPAIQAERQAPYEHPPTPQPQQKITPGPVETVTKKEQPPMPPAPDLPAVEPGVITQLSAADIMQTGTLWADPDDCVGQAFADMRRYNADYMIVGRDGLAQGIVSTSDIKAALSPYLRPEFAKWCRPLDEATLQIKIKWIMSTPVRTVRAEASLTTVMQNMRRFHVRCMPVTDPHNIVQGLVTVNDVFQALLRHKAHLKESAPATEIRSTSAPPAGSRTTALVTHSP